MIIARYGCPMGEGHVKNPGDCIDPIMLVRMPNHLWSQAAREGRKADAGGMRKLLTIVNARRRDELRGTQMTIQIA